ncbi:porin family protein [Pollutibacter soli]|uniref:porin family protein n=1 Tax=Pollutibacter soli TaxID=3034157 RepID=UPI0030136C65
MKMKKWLIASFVLLVISGTTYAQKFQVGLKAGMNASNFTGGNIDSKTLLGFHAGTNFNFLLGNNFSISPEILFSSQGAKYNELGTEKNLKVSYIQVPVLAKFRFNGGLYLEAGPQVGFKVGEDVDIPNQTIDNFAKNLDLGIGAGLGFHSRSGFGIGARYIAGLSKVGDFNASEMNPDFKNSVIQLSLFYTFFNNRR